MNPTAIFAAGFLVLFVGGGARFTIGLTFKPMVSEFDWARGELGLAVGVYLVVSAFATYLAGRLADRMSPRAVLNAGVIMSGIGIGLMCLVSRPWHALFLYGIAAAEGGGSRAMLTGGLVGIALGVAVGYALYAGLLRIPLRWFFAATGLLVLFLGAGMASQAARFLIQADVLPSLAAPAWDTSAVLSESSIPGVLLHSLIGYEARPAGMQIVAYVGALVTIAIAMKWTNRRPRRVANA